jgi:hypothetical protein
MNIYVKISENRIPHYCVHIKYMSYALSMFKEVVMPFTMCLVDRTHQEDWVVEEWWTVGGVWRRVRLLGMWYDTHLLFMLSIVSVTTCITSYNRTLRMSALYIVW